jgi:peptide-methionine (S)-S-oxide reductase
MNETKPVVAVFGGGCFWCTEAVFKMLMGVSDVRPGYAGGTSRNPTYGEVSSGRSGHAEVIHIEYDPSLIRYTDLLTVFFASHDPTTLNRQGNDVGTQYRSIILYASEQQKKDAEEFITTLQNSSAEGDRIVTEIKPLEAFYEAEDYHKNYYESHKDAPYCQVIINPKLEKVQQKFAELLKENNIS